MPSAPRVSVIIVNYNAGALIGACLAALLAQDMSDLEAIVVDNASSDGSIEAVEQIGDSRVRVLRLGENTGFAAGVNRGLELATAPWVATLNPDAFPARDWLSSFLAAAAGNPGVRLFGSMQIDAENETRLDGCGDCYHPTGIFWRGGYGHPVGTCTTGEVFGPCAAAAFYDAELLREVGGFDETFFCYCEDVDLAFRLRLLGHRCLQLESARVRHVGSATSGKSSDFSLYHSVRNRIWVIVKNMPLPLLVGLFPIHLAATLYLLYRCRRSPAFAPQWRGFKAGLAGVPAAWKARRAIQARRRASSAAIARSFTWSMDKLRRQEPDIRPMAPAVPAGANIGN